MAYPAYRYLTLTYLKHDLYVSYSYIACGNSNLNTYIIYDSWCKPFTCKHGLYSVNHWKISGLGMKYIKYVRPSSVSLQGCNMIPGLSNKTPETFITLVVVEGNYADSHPLRSSGTIFGVFQPPRRCGFESTWICSQKEMIDTIFWEKTPYAVYIYMHIYI